ncbi:hypothetical protein M422DRAFT_49234 [Sphaerobolus stellatus SS14]|uniref:DUF4149 domain-containing protein n=1 Tax=Sphaerobolus stellatus (strain SS14) TaxID=990650 RepID=A0A0C9VFV5_SPHS4|nr:hypothetical protein M422DRAFT_49234 [Sphaerobolus stellatus SS14]
MMSFVGLMSFLVFALTAAYAGLLLHPVAPTFEDSLSPSQAEAMIQAYQDKEITVYTALQSFYIIGTFALIPLAIFVKSRVNSDSILNAMSLSIVPLLILRAIATIVLIAISDHAQKNLNASIQPFNGPAFDFASIMVQEWLYFGAILIICYYFVHVARWNRPNGKLGF